jgi:uncharacterized RmlC-like cupin family protein
VLFEWDPPAIPEYGELVTRNYWQKPYKTGTSKLAGPSNPRLGRFDSFAASWPWEVLARDRRRHSRMPNAVLVVPPDELRPGAASPGVTRELAVETRHATVMRARAEALACSGWHHHGEREVLGYVVTGQARFEFGRGGNQSVDVEAGGFFHVPPGVVHRDVNPLDQPQEIVMTVVGSGPLVVNVDGPDS